ncbi:hypothetical protein FLAG1_08313 [Fusarium langsethiae]|uniref:Uncharacterized protein n=1 Tax=Fusarium langsethiae TaxID=179993 RepID=A0A0N0DCY1_FUSLA|nr:hypothetical protein FLAG1_08313 [Fusarium langsethiae]GKU07577.1 unnamed protein product [Fusarium langsethiae]GKU22374.1 unnamed protein product [Fusarium langsethiae]
MPPAFTFVNVSNAPGLGPKERREMRAHVTQTNFAKRRQRLAKARDDGKSDAMKSNSAVSRSNNQRLRTEQTSKDVFAFRNPCYGSLLTNMTDSTHSVIGYILYTFRPFISPAGTVGPGSPREADWVGLFQSEPALVEASISIALRHCAGQKDNATFRQAVLHKGRAIKRVNQKLGSPSGLTDGILSAVFTLIYAELLENDCKARSAHVEGLAQMILALLSASHSNQPLIRALRNQDVPKGTDIATIRNSINELCLMVDNYHNSPISQPDIAVAIRLEVERLQVEIDTLLGSHGNYIRSLHHTLRLYLLLLWPMEEPDHLHILAEELKHVLLQSHMRLCPSMQLLVWQLFVGLTAAEPSSEARSWYIARLREIMAIKTESTTGCKDDQGVIEPGTLVFSGQLITSEDAPSTPIYQLNRELACKVQRNMAMIFESVQFTETTNPENNMTRKRKTTQDLYYLVHLRNKPSQDDVPIYYMTAASPGTMGNIQLDVSSTEHQKEELRAMLNADKSAADILLFNRDTQQLLFDIKPKWQGGQYQWIDVNGLKVASESWTSEKQKLHIEVPLGQQKKDALVALWILRLWHGIVEGRVTEREVEEHEKNTKPIHPLDYPS